MSHPVLEKTLSPDVQDLFPEFEKAGHPFDVSFTVVVNPAVDHHSETFDVYMHNEFEKLRIDTLQTLNVKGHTREAKVAFVKAAYTEACHDLSVSFQQATEKPMQMAGWTVQGGERRFIMSHKGEREVLRHMAYATGLDAHDLLGLAPHHPGNVMRAQMIFKY